MKRGLKIVLIIVAVLFVLWFVSFLFYYFYDKKNSCENINFHDYCENICEEAKKTSGPGELFEGADSYVGAYKIERYYEQYGVGSIGVNLFCYCGELEFPSVLSCR